MRKQGIFLLNFARPQQLAVKLLLRQNITSIRTDPFHLNCNGTILVDSIQHYSSCVGLSPEDFMSESAKDCVVLQKGPLYLILYNNFILCSARKRWSVAHEIGHICCRHTSDGPAEEAQANAFAASLLVPSIVAEELVHRKVVRSPKDLCGIFGVSVQAAELRYQELFCHPKTALEQELLDRYLPVIEEEIHGPMISIPHRPTFEHAPVIL